MFIYLLALWITLAAFDAHVTIRAIERHGVEVELNPAIRKLCAWWGTKRGVTVGIAIPTLIIASLCWIFEPVVLLAFLDGMRAMLALEQIAKIHNNAY